MKEENKKRLKEQRKVLESAEQKTSVILKSLLSKYINNIKKQKGC